MESSTQASQEENSSLDTELTTRNNCSSAGDSSIPGSSRMEIQQELAEMSFEELKQLKEELGSKLYNEAMFGKKKTTHKTAFKRENKNRPREYSSKQPVSSFREVIKVGKRLNRDPRFDSLSGQFTDKVFQQRYNFLSDIRENERRRLRENMRKESEPDKVAEAAHQLQRMENQDREKKRREEKEKQKTELKKEQIEKLMQGKKLFFKSKVTIQQEELIKKYEKLKKSGKLDKYIEKRRKKNTSKERRRLPFNS